MLTLTSIYMCASSATPPLHVSPGAQPGCVPLQTAKQLFPQVMTGKRRTLLTFSCARLTEPFDWLSGAGDTLWTQNGSKYSEHVCGLQIAWLDAFYTAVRARLRGDVSNWRVLDGPDTRIERAACGP